MKTHIKLFASVAMIALLGSCSKDSRYSDNAQTDPATQTEVLRGSTWRAEKETERSFFNNIMLNEHSLFFNEDSQDQNAFDLVFANDYVYKVMRSSGDTTEKNRYSFDGVTMLLFNYDSQNNDLEDEESNRRTVTISGNIMTSVDLGLDRSHEDENNDSDNDGLFDRRIERITILRRVR